MNSSETALLATDLLKERTRELHRSVDRHPLMQRVVAKDLTATEYGTILASLYSWHERVAPVLDTLKLEPHFYSIDKLAALAEDLRWLPHTPIDFENNSLKEQADEAYSLGVLYVVEGSSLGAQFIAPRVEASLGSQRVTHYYRLYGDAVTANWRTTQSILNSRLDDIASIERALRGARDAFALLLTVVDLNLTEPKGFEASSI